MKDPRLSFIFSERGHGYICIHEEAFGCLYKIEVVTATEQACYSGNMEAYTTQIVFAPGRAAWKAAMRIARLLLKTHRRLRAFLEKEDLAQLRQIDLAYALQGCVELPPGISFTPPPLALYAPAA